jgi:polyhydroxybutyrate depolymerase
MVMGTDDPLVPYRGGGFGASQVLSAKATARLWRELADCRKPTSRRLPDRDPKDGTAVRLLTARKCTGDAAVKLYSVHGGGHTWPGGRQYLPKTAIGRTSRDFDASATIWLFLADKTR